MSYNVINSGNGNENRQMYNVLGSGGNMDVKSPPIGTQVYNVLGSGSGSTDVNGPPVYNILGSGGNTEPKVGTQVYNVMGSGSNMDVKSPPVYKMGSNSSSYDSKSSNSPPVYNVLNSPTGSNTGDPKKISPQLYSFNPPTSSNNVTTIETKVMTPPDSNPPIYSILPGGNNTPFDSKPIKPPFLVLNEDGGYSTTEKSPPIYNVINSPSGSNVNDPKAPPIYSVLSSPTGINNIPPNNNFIVDINQKKSPDGSSFYENVYKVKTEVQEPVKEQVNEELKEETLILMQEMLLMMKDMSLKIENLENEVQYLKGQLSHQKGNISSSVNRGNQKNSLYDLRK